MPDDEDKSLAAWAAQDIGDEPAPVVVETPVEVAAADPAPEPIAAADSLIAEAAIEPEVAADPIPEPGKKTGVEKRIAQLTAKEKEAWRVAQENQTRAVEADARRIAAEAELAEMRRRSAAPVPAADGKPAETPADYVPASEVDKRAERIASQRAFDAQANAAYYAGKEAYSDFDDALQPLRALDLVGRPDFQQAALATDAAHDVIYYLGNNPAEASKVLADLRAGNSAKAAAQMTKIAMSISAKKAAEAKAPPKVSSAPAPIRPVGGSAMPNVDLEKLSDDDFTAEFDKKARANGWY